MGFVMKIIGIDFESFYSDEYSLRRMTPVEYILDPRFETIGCAVAVGGLTGFLDHDGLVAYLKKLPAQVAIVSHNALFDMCLLAYRYNYVPTMMIDTLGMSRAWWGHLYKRHGIAALAEARGIGIKGTTVSQVKGMRKADIVARGLWDDYARYSVNDIEIAMALFRQMMDEGFPKSELEIQDMVLRCAVQPKFRLDQNTLAIHLNEVVQNKANLLAKCGIYGKDDLMSNDRFADALRSLGIDPPTKTSLATGKTTYAFAKTDQDFIELEEHEDEDVQALVTARMGIKSTLEESRTQRFLNIANLTWPGNEQKLMPVPLRYGAAHTHRLGGDWKLNMQNMPRGSKAKPPRLRESLLARAACLVVKADASQIEARFVADFCDQADLRDRFASGEDVYASLASDIFGFKVDKNIHQSERFIGKTAVLGCGFSVGGEKFARTVRMDSKKYTGTMIQMDTQEGARCVGIYREKNFKVPLMWGRLDHCIPEMTRKDCSIKIGPIIIEHEKVRLPNGLFLNYHKLEYKEYKNEQAWWFEYGGQPKKIYGGKFLENIIQALARLATMEAAARIKHRLSAMAVELGLDPVEFFLGLQEHDALAYGPPEEFADIVGEILVEEMVRRPDWAPTVPLACQDGYGVGISYGHAK